MKKALILFAALLFSTVVSYAQTEKGKQTLGLDLGFLSFNKTNGVSINPSDGSTSDADSKSNSFNIGPNYSYFVADKLDFGAALSYGLNNYNYPSIPNNSEKQSSYAYGGTIYLRKYFMYQDKIGLRAGPYLGYTKSDYKSTYNGSSFIFNEDSKTDAYNAGIKLDLVYYPSKSLGLSASIASLGYSHFKTDNGSQGHTDGDNVSMGFVSSSLALSVFYVFGK